MSLEKIYFRLLLLAKAGKEKQLMWEINCFSFPAFPYKSRPKYIFFQRRVLQVAFQIDISQCEKGFRLITIKDIYGLYGPGLTAICVLRKKALSHAKQSLKGELRIFRTL